MSRFEIHRENVTVDKLCWAKEIILKTEEMWRKEKEWNQKEEKKKSLKAEKPISNR